MFRYRQLAPPQLREVQVALIYRGSDRAERVYRKLTQCTRKEAQHAVRSIARSIEPGPA
jgi:hypothetical protein